MSGFEKFKRILSDARTGAGRQSLHARLAARLSSRVAPSFSQHHVLAEDILGASRTAPQPTPRPSGRPLRIGWIVTPPIPGSGGHTTAFRMVEELQLAGHRCELLLYDVFGGSVEERTGAIRAGWPHLDVEVRSLDSGLDGLDACVATGWQTAYALSARSRGLDLHRFYFIQDYEPFFYARGYEYELAEATYRLGFHMIALGEMIEEHLGALGVPCSRVPFGCDTDDYTLLAPRPRSGVVLYARASTPRRGPLLAMTGLEEFHRRRPDVPIKVFGPQERASFTFPVDWQGRLTPGQLNELYNSSVAGLGLSFTNISLVVDEMLAAGCVPVVNDSHDGRLVVRSPHVRWVEPTPAALADALTAVVDEPPTDFAAMAASTNPSWRVTRERFAAVVTDSVTGRGSA